MTIKQKTPARAQHVDLEPVSSLESHLGFWLRFVSNHVSGRFEKSVEDAGVSLSDWVALRSMYGRSETSAATLMAELGMTKGAISKIISRLEEKGLLTRETSDSDRRAQYLALTKKGKALVPKLARLADENDALFFAHLTPAEKQGMLGILQKIVAIHGLKTVPVQ